MSTFATATQRGDRNTPKQLLASDVHVVTGGGGKVRQELNAIDAADRVARFLVESTRKHQKYAGTRRRSDGIGIVKVLW